MADIAARSGDAATVFRCAATWKFFRREILREDFIRRVTGGGPDAIVPSNFLGVLSRETFSVVHPITEVAETIASRHMAPFLSRSAAGLVEEYAPLASRRGLVVLRRRVINRRRWSQRRSDMCVYDPMTGTRAFFPDPPDVGRSPYHPTLGGGSVAMIDCSVLLTAADGIDINGCPFMLLAADMDRSLDLSVRIRVQTLSPDDDGGGKWKWGPMTTSADHQCPWWCMSLDSYSDGGVVIGGVVHWLLHAGVGFAFDVGEYILTYDIGAATAGSVDLPQHRRVPNLRGSGCETQLGSSPDGKLSLIVTDRLMVSVWVLSASAGGEGACWSRHAEVDMIPWCFALVPEPQDDDRGQVVLESLGDQSRAVFWRLVVGGDKLCFLLDMETKETCLDFAERKGIPFEVDLASRLSSMKAF